MKDYNSKCARWAIKLSFYKFDIEHISGKSNTVADHLSRFIEQNETHEDGTEYLQVTGIARTGFEKFEQFKDQLIEKRESLLSDYNNELKYKKILETLQSGKSFKGFMLKDGILTRQVYKSPANRVYFATCISSKNPIIKDILSELHSESHLGRDKMYDLISNRFYWPNIWKDIYPIRQKVLPE